MKKIAITGANGFVGKHLTRMFTSNGFEVISIKRADLKNSSKLISIVNDCEVVINLAGANILAYWSDIYKKLMYDSRIETTKTLLRAFRQCDIKPKLFISTSAVGIYNDKKECSEDNIEYADNFLGQLCRDWEKEALQAQELDIRTVIFRFGIVMGTKGGALAQMLPAFRFGVGGVIGDGEQSFSFVHIKDLLSAYRYVIENKTTNGKCNLTAPVPTTNKELTKTIGKVIHRPTILPIPKFVLNLLYGEGAKILTDGQSVVPKKLLENGFEFKYKTIDETIHNLLGEQNGKKS